MLECIIKIASLFRKQKLNSDSFTSKLCYRFLSSFLLASAVLTISNNYFGKHMECFSKNPSVEPVLETSCWNQGTWVYAKVDEIAYERLKLTVDPNVTLETYARVVEIAPGVREKSDGNDEEKVFHQMYLFLPFIYVLFAASCQIGRYSWCRFQGHLLPQLLRDIKNPILQEQVLDQMIEDAATKFSNNTPWYNHLFWIYACVVFINLGTVLLQYSIITFLYTEEDYFFGYTVLMSVFKPYEAWPFELARKFPLISKCTVVTYGGTGELLPTDAICFMIINRVNITLFALHWWFLFILIPLTIIEFVSHVLILILPAWRRIFLINLLNVNCKSDVGKLLRDISYGPAFMVTLMVKNIPKDYVCRIVEDSTPVNQSNDHEMR